jgi:hypothetical protein
MKAKTSRFQTGEMLDALSATRDQRESAREKTVRATGRRDEAGGRGGKGIEIRRRARAAALFRHGTEGAPAAVEGRDAKALESWSQKICGAIQKQDIHLYINSPGGSVTSGLAIYDTMQYLTCDVNTYCVGQAASMGAVLLAAGTKGKRYALPNANIMIHQVLGGAEGQASDVEIRVKYMLKLKQRLNGILSKAHGQAGGAGGEGLRPRQFHVRRGSEGLRHRGPGRGVAKRNSRRNG